jgi:hypothetical protein
MVLLAIACLQELPGATDSSPTPADDCQPTEELCNGLDDDCDGDVDEDARDMLALWVDGDGDGFGDPQQPVLSCEDGPGLSDNDLDCDDSEASTHPGADELCDEVDNDCDGDLDEDAVDVQTWFEDADGDGYGSGEEQRGCWPPATASDVSGDCDESNPYVNPDALEACDGVDNDCSGLIDQGGVCPCPVEHYGDHAYMFCEAYELTWSEAEAACVHYGYHLVTLDDEAENLWVTDVLDGYGEEDWWCGLNDLAEEDVWVWVSGSESSYRSWASGQPNNWLWNQHCVVLYSEGDATWNDESCSGHNRFVCELE